MEVRCADAISFHGQHDSHDPGWELEGCRRPHGVVAGSVTGSPVDVHVEVVVVAAANVVVAVVAAGSTLVGCGRMPSGNPCSKRVMVRLGACCC